jgi:hypothetical protein
LLDVRRGAVATVAAIADDPPSFLAIKERERLDQKFVPSPVTL